MYRKINRCLSMIIIIALVTLMIPTVALAAPSADSSDAILERINKEYGTNIRVISPEEALNKYDVAINNVPVQSGKQLANLEEELRHIAQYEIPQIKLTTQRANEKMVSFQRRRF